jgi:hypothetical protein
MSVRSHPLCPPPPTCTKIMLRWTRQTGSTSDVATISTHCPPRAPADDREAPGARLEEGVAEAEDADSPAGRSQRPIGAIRSRAPSRRRPRGISAGGRCREQLILVLSPWTRRNLRSRVPASTPGGYLDLRLPPLPDTQWTQTRITDSAVGRSPGRGRLRRRLPAAFAARRSAVYARRSLHVAGRSAGAALVLTPATGTAHMFVQSLVGPGYQQYPRILLVHPGQFILGGVVADAACQCLRVVTYGRLSPEL